jgi:hypothetical protein
VAAASVTVQQHAVSRPIEVPAQLDEIGVITDEYNKVLLVDSKATNAPALRAWWERQCSQLNK